MKLLFMGTQDFAVPSLKALIDNNELEIRLLKKYDKVIPKPTLFDHKILTPIEQLNMAYRFRNMEVAYDTLNE